MNKRAPQKLQKLPVVRKITLKHFEDEKGVQSLFESLKANDQFLNPDNPRRFIQALIYEYRVWGRKMLPKIPFPDFIQKVHRLPKYDAMNIINKTAATVFGCPDVPVYKPKRGRNADNLHGSFISGSESEDGSFLDTRVKNLNQSQSEELEHTSEDQIIQRKAVDESEPQFTEESGTTVFPVGRAETEISDDL